MKYDIIIIGGGIVGLATALEIKRNNPAINLAILEKESGLALHQTGNNSGVIHAGLYYKPGSLKATNCLLGYRKLTDFCLAESIPFELCGKLVVATRTEELPRLEDLYNRGLENGLSRIRKINAAEIPFYEPSARGLAALHVPYTGIVDYLQVARKYASILENKYDVAIHTSCEVTGIRKAAGKAEINTPSGCYTSNLIINTAGLHSDHIALMDLPTLDVRIIPFRGEYFSLKEEYRSLVKNLIYPVPDPSFPFLGVHFTRRINGEVEAGPNAVFAFGREAYHKTNVNMRELAESLRWRGFRKVMLKYWNMGLGEYYRSFSKSAFTQALQKLIPEIRMEHLRPGGAGIRAQACSSDGQLIDDFLIRESEIALHVLNAPSPAATASLAIGETIAVRALKKLNDRKTL
ncbi:MAG: L-2-hydroxyglutarate oxidase [Bacteroidales bacterium]